jgi:predicted DNA-binding transcriptional regulator AlpA
MKSENAPTRECLTKPFLTSVEVGAILGVTDRTVRAWAGQGIFPRPVKIGGVVRWRRADIDTRMSAQ